MAQGSSKLMLEMMLVLMGKESPDRFMASLFLLVLGDTLLTSEVLTMLETIYIPEGLLLPVILVLAVMSIFGPVLCAVYRKNESKGKAEGWNSRYISTMIADMLLTPFVGLIIMSLIVQKWFPDISDVTYLVFLPIILFATSMFLLTLMNEGIKAVVEQIKRTKGEIEDAKKELKN